MKARTPSVAWWSPRPELFFVRSGPPDLHPAGRFAFHVKLGSAALATVVPWAGGTWQADNFASASGAASAERRHHGGVARAGAAGHGRRDAAGGDHTARCHRWPYSRGLRCPTRSALSPPQPPRSPDVLSTVGCPIHSPAFASPSDSPCRINWTWDVPPWERRGVWLPAFDTPCSLAWRSARASTTPSAWAGLVSGCTTRRCDILFAILRNKTNCQRPPQSRRHSIGRRSSSTSPSSARPSIPTHRRGKLPRFNGSSLSTLNTRREPPELSARPATWWAGSSSGPAVKPNSRSETSTPASSTAFITTWTTPKNSDPSVPVATAEHPAHVQATQPT
ncbi:hypothetical protein YIM_48275 [Amycolatopsis sp. YIM 10]|nr:hypothetical protein YIM_48275 [Amycolatopsis sp. YIM 10]